MSKKIKDIYIVHVGGYVGGYFSDTGKVKHDKGDQFLRFCKKLMNKYPEYRMRCVMNKGIEQAVWKHINYDKLRIYQLKNGGRNGK